MRRNEGLDEGKGDVRYFGKKKGYLLTKMVESKGILKGAKSAQLRCIFILSHGIFGFGQGPGDGNSFT